VLALFTVFSYLGWFQFQAESLQSIISLLATVVNFVLPCGLAMIVLFGFDTIIRPQLQFPS
jgi:hypothetical protein